MTVIPKDTFRDKIWGLPAADLLGVGRATQRVLDSYCIRTIGDLAKTDPDFLNRRLGKNGIALWQYANGNDRSRVMNADFVSPVKSVGHGITTIEDLENDEQVWPVFLELTQDIGHKLRVHKSVRMESPFTYGTTHFFKAMANGIGYAYTIPNADCKSGFCPL